MKFYVAGKWEEREQVRQLQDGLRQLGHSITMDWTYREPTDTGYPIKHAIEDIEGVKTCDIVVCRVVNSNAYKGALVEVGAALGLGKQVVIIGHAIDSCIFIHHPLVSRHSNTIKFLAWVERL